MKRGKRILGESRNRCSCSKASQLSDHHLRQTTYLFSYFPDLFNTHLSPPSFSHMSTLACYNYIRDQAQMAVNHEKDLIRKVCCFHGIHDQTEIERTIEHFVDTTLLKRCLKPKKDLNAPKRNLSSYMLFSASIREEVTKANPGLEMGAMSKLIGEKWALAGEEVKAEFQKKAEADKDRYQQEMDEYQQKLYEQDGSLMGVGASNNAV